MYEFRRLKSYRQAYGGVEHIHLLALAVVEVAEDVTVGLVTRE